MKKRILSALLAVCIAASLLTLPAGAAAATGFADISDPNVAAAAECLRLLGVMDGFSPNTFGPDGQVTRAQLCKMAVYAMNGGDQLGRYRTVTVYPDVKPSYWAAPYINMASDSSRGSTGDKDTADHSIIKGYMDGKFHPERVVTVGQAVTILMRMLGYADSDMGGIWPDGYMSAASTVGLTDGMNAAASAPLTRGQAALLFLNLLRSDLKGGESYGASIANEVKEGVMLASSTAFAADGTETGMQLSSGEVYSMANKASTGALNGYKGTLLVNKAGKVMTFVPETSVSSNRVVSFASATASKLTTTTGESFAINGITKMYFQSKGEELTWSAGWTKLVAGMSLTLYVGASGGVEYIFVGGSTASNAAVVVYSKGSTAGFDALANGGSYSIYKNGVAATAGDLRPYDVATYSPATNAIRVCDNRITGIYEAASPSPTNPTKLTMMGAEFDVLTTALDTVSKLTVGQQITLLLTEDNKVAGAVPADNPQARGNAIGIAKITGSSATVQLICGITLSGKTNVTEEGAQKLNGQIALVSSSSKGVISLTQLSGGGVGTLDVSARKMGDRSLADNVVIYQSTGGGVEVLGMKDIPAATVPASGVLYARINWAGKIDLIVLTNITGSDYVFGRLSYTPREPKYDKDGNITGYTPSGISIIAGDKAYGPYPSGFDIEGDVDVHDGDFVAAKLTTAGSEAIDSLYLLTKFSGVANSAWIGSTAVTIGGRSYTVQPGVLCYNRTAKSWVTLDEARAYATTATLYADKSGFIRVVEVSQ